MRLFCSLLFASAALFAQPQQTLPITKSVSNIKNNLAISPTGGLICQTEAKKPCTAQDVKEISGALNLAKLGIKPLTAGANGAVVCETTAGKPCTKDQSATVANALQSAKVGEGIGNVGVSMGTKSDPSNPNK